MSDEHLTDEVLSAVLDGEAMPAEARHAGSCAMCGVRLAELQQAASVVGSPVPAADPARRETAIAAALGARAVPLASRRQRVPTWVLGAAALVVAVLALVPLVVRSGDGDDADRDGATDMAMRVEDSAASGAGGTAAGPVALGDLGPVDGTALADRVRGALAPAAADTTAGDDSALAAPSAAQTQERASETPCVAELAASTPGLGDLRATGVAEVGGRRAAVLAYASADGRIRVLAVAVDACDDVLLSVSFPAPQS